MLTGLTYTPAHFKVPDQPVDPPAADEDDYARNCRNGIREEIIELLASAVCRLDELDYDGEGRDTQVGLEALQEKLIEGMED